MKQPTRVIRATDRVFLIRTRGQQPQPHHQPQTTYFAVHDMARITHTSCAMLVAFAREEDAHAWARSLDAHKQQHGAYPPRELPRQTKRLPWVREDACPDAPELDVVPMPFTDVLAMLKGTGVNCRLLHDGRNMVHRTDVVQHFDKAAVCSRLEHSLTLACGDVL